MDQCLEIEDYLAFKAENRLLLFLCAKAAVLALEEVN